MKELSYYNKREVERLYVGEFIIVEVNGFGVVERSICYFETSGDNYVIVSGEEPRIGGMGKIVD